MRGHCWGCKHIKELVHTDPLSRRFCNDCLEVTRMSPNQVLSVAFLAATVPFEIGDHVECRTAGERYEGTGKIVKVSMDLKDGGTPVIPMFHVVYDRDHSAHDRDDGWFSEYDLVKVA